MAGARRSMLANLVGLLNTPEPIQWPRPPGAVREGVFHAKCTRCGDCITACPHGAIGKMPEGTAHAGTPALNPNSAPCHLCEDLPCISACPEGVLVPVPREHIFFGIAHINPDTCFVYKGPECGACVPACPLNAVVTLAGKPKINPDTCNGCGLCREACPVWDKAIIVDL